MTRDPNPYSREQIQARIRARRERSHRAPSFYERALDASDRELIADARELEGMDEEVALLRLQIRRLLEDEPGDHAALHSGIRLLVQTLTARHRLSGREAETLTERASDLLEHFASMFANAGAGGGNDEGGAR